MATELKLYHYWRSSSSWRVRWALELKKIPYQTVAINLLTDEPESPTHLSRNPAGYVPVLEFPENISERSDPPLQYLSESMAIIEYLNEWIPSPNLLPGSLIERARIRQLAEIINSGTQPLQNPGVGSQHSSDQEEQKKWNQHWIRKGLTAYEALARETAGSFSFGNQVTLADLFLIPQCYNAQRFEISLDEFPLLGRIYQNSLETEPCRLSSPERFKPS